MIDKWTFTRGWKEDRKIIFWIMVISLIAAVGFLIAAICLWLLAKFPVQLARIVLGAACLAGILLGLFALDRLWLARNLYNNYALRDLNNRLLNGLFIVVCIAIALLFINSLLNVFKKRTGHFILAILLIILLFITVCLLGLVLRDMRKRQFNRILDSKHCASLLDAFHESDIKASCPNKYLSTPCTKSFLVSHWETDKKPIFLNPGCCHSVNAWLLWPTYIAGILILLMITAILVVIAVDLFLSDTSEYLEFTDKKIGLFDIVFLLLAVLALVAFGFYFGFRPKDKIPREN